RAGRIDEPGGEAPGAGVHRLAEQPLHPAQVVGAGRPRLEAHGRDAQGAVADEVHDVDRRPHAPQRVEILAEGLPLEVRGDDDAAAQQERPGHRYSSVMVTDFILSPWRMRSTCSMPLVTLPNTV